MDLALVLFGLYKAKLIGFRALRDADALANEQRNCVRTGFEGSECVNVCAVIWKLSSVLLLLVCVRRFPPRCLTLSRSALQLGGDPFPDGNFRAFTSCPGMTFPMGNE